MTFTTEQREQAKALAVQYQAWMAAVDTDDVVGRSVWGEKLLESQAAIGVTLVSPSIARTLIDNARRDPRYAEAIYGKNTLPHMRAIRAGGGL